MNLKDIPIRRWIKFYMSSGDDITLPEDKAQSVLQSPDQLVMVTFKSGEWSGITINKAHIVSTQYDHTKTKEEHRQKIYEIEAQERKMLQDGVHVPSTKGLADKMRVKELQGGQS